MGALTIDTATRYEGPRVPGGGLWTFATTSTMSPTLGSPTIFVSESTLHRAARDRPRRRRDRLDGPMPREQLRRRERPVGFDARRDEAAGIHDGDDREHARGEIFDPFDGAVRAAAGPFRARVRCDHVEEHRELAARDVHRLDRAGQLARARLRHHDLRRREGRRREHAGMTSGTVTCATTRAPTRIHDHGRGFARRSSPPVIVAFVTSIWIPPSMRSRIGPATFETVPSTVDALTGMGNAEPSPAAATGARLKRRRATTRAEEVPKRGSREVRARRERVVIVALLPVSWKCPGRNRSHDFGV